MKPKTHMQLPLGVRVVKAVQKQNKTQVEEMGKGVAVRQHPRFNLEGKLFGRLTALRAVEFRRKYGEVWLCRCVCGNLKRVLHRSLTKNLSRSCGCLRKKYPKGITPKSKTFEYSSWRSMKHRCLNPDNIGFRFYGGKGVKICNRWLKSFDLFLEDMGKRPFGKALERIDNNGNYCPSNCRWATRKEQVNNRSVTIKITFKNRTLSASGWSELTGIDYGVICRRFKRGLEIKDILTLPTRKCKIPNKITELK